jgi:predicted secreted protein
MPDTTPAFVPGYLGTITINSVNQSSVLHVTALNQSRAGLAKPTFGSSHKYAIGGQREFTFSAQGSITPAALTGLQTAFELDTSVEFSLQVGDAAGATDAGLYAGYCVITALNLEGSADGQWSVSLEGMGTGEPVYTAPTP